MDRRYETPSIPARPTSVPTARRLASPQLRGPVTTIAQVVLTWTAPEVPGTETRAPVTRYEIQWQQSDSADDDLAGWADATTVSPTPPTNTTYTHTSVEGAKRYAYRVRAVNSVGPGEWSAQDDCRRPLPETPTHRL